MENKGKVETGPEYDRCACGHFDHEHAGRHKACTVCTCNQWDWDMDGEALVPGWRKVPPASPGARPCPKCLVNAAINDECPWCGKIAPARSAP